MVYLGRGHIDQLSNSREGDVCIRCDEYNALCPGSEDRFQLSREIAYGDVVHVYPGLSGEKRLKHHSSAVVHSAGREFSYSQLNPCDAGPLLARTAAAIINTAGNGVIFKIIAKPLHLTDTSIASEVPDDPDSLRECRCFRSRF